MEEHRENLANMHPRGNYTVRELAEDHLEVRMPSISTVN